MHLVAGCTNAPVSLTVTTPPHTRPYSAWAHPWLEQTCLSDIHTGHLHICSAHHWQHTGDSLLRRQGRALRQLRGCVRPGCPCCSLRSPPGRSAQRARCKGPGPWPATPHPPVHAYMCVHQGCVCRMGAQAGAAGLHPKPLRMSIRPMPIAFHGPHWSDLGSWSQGCKQRAGSLKERSHTGLTCASAGREGGSCPSSECTVGTASGSKASASTGSRGTHTLPVLGCTQKGACARGDGGRVQRIQCGSSASCCHCGCCVLDRCRLDPRWVRPLPACTSRPTRAHCSGALLQ